jgi:hypothetical protein
VPGGRQPELAAIVTELPTSAQVPAAAGRALWERWQEGVTVRITLPTELPLRMLLDNLPGYKTPPFVCWFFAHGIMPLYTPL